MTTDYRTYQLTVPEALRFLGVSYAGIALLLFLFYHSLLLAGVGGFLCLLLLDPYRRWLAERRRHLLLVQFRDLLLSFASSFAASRQMTEALQEGCDNLAALYGPKTPMMQELRYLVRATSENRGSEEELLINFAQRSACEDIRDFVDVYTMCRVTGGSIEEVIRNASEILADKIAVEREMRALTAQKRFEGRIIAAMPVVLVLMLNVLSPDYLEVMYHTIGGRLIMTLALAGMAVSWVLSARLMRLEV